MILAPTESDAVRAVIEPRRVVVAVIAVVLAFNAVVLARPEAGTRCS